MCSKYHPKYTHIRHIFTFTSYILKYMYVKRANIASNAKDRCVSKSKRKLHSDTTDVLRNIYIYALHIFLRDYHWASYCAFCFYYYCIWGLSKLLCFFLGRNSDSKCERSRNVYSRLDACLSNRQFFWIPKVSGTNEMPSTMEIGIGKKYKEEINVGKCVLLSLLIS